MLGIVKEINGEKKIIPLTTDTGTGAPVGTLIQQYKKKPISGYLYCDGSRFDENVYPALYMYLGKNELPDYRECVMVGAEQNTTDTIATHDVYAEGEFKDDQLQNHEHDSARASQEGSGGPNVSVLHTVPLGTTMSGGGEVLDMRGRSGETTHGKQKAVYVYIKATSGLAENQQDNVLNEVKRYLEWNYKTVSCAGGTSGAIEIPTGYNGNYEYSVFDYKYHTSLHGIHLASDSTITLGNIATNFDNVSNDSILLSNIYIEYNRESAAGDFRIAFRPIPSGIAI